METDTVLSERFKDPILSVPKLKMKFQEENSSAAILCCEDKKVDLHSKYNGEESSSDDEFTECEPTRKIKDDEEDLSQKEPDLHLKPSYNKWETKIKVESNNRSIDEAFDIDLMDSCVIKKETNEVKEIAAEQLFLERPIKSEIIEQEEVHIKQEEDNENGLRTQKVPKPVERTALHPWLHHWPECSYNTNCKDSLKLHSTSRLKKEYKIDWYRCQECPYKTYQVGDLRTHLKKHNNLLLKCSKCSYVALKPRSLKEHQKKHKPDNEWLHCSECSYKTYLRVLLQSHMLAHKSKSFKCPKCPYEARRKDQITEHQVKHESMDKWHSCPLCNFKTHAKSTFAAHCREHHSLNPNTMQNVIFKCTECSFDSGSKTKLKTHQLIHDQSCWLQCPDCTYKTPYKRSLNSHRLQHQGENAEGWHRCPYCPHKSTLYSSLQRHIRRQHKSFNKIQPTNKIDFECLQCSFKTAHKASLSQHQLRHKKAHEIQWFCCYECSFKTKYKSDLVRHLFKHKKEIDKG